MSESTEVNEGAGETPQQPAGETTEPPAEDKPEEAGE